MKIRAARVSDAPAICGIVNYFAERGRMLHRSLESVYDAIREFDVAEDAEGNVVGCVALDVYWSDLAEIKSLAVLPAKRGAGIGSKLTAAAVRDARRLGVRRVFTLTYEKEFFRNHGFRVVSRAKLPDKVWRECIGCPKEEACDETAMMINPNRAGVRGLAGKSKRGRGGKPSTRGVSRRHGGR
ncbi:MAG TPA: N-acetyltransferase [Phycisphaerae bacterium]|nr:N-acetyltransferase [Phycisphaerae bacterium]